MKLQGTGQGALLLDSAPQALDEILGALGRKRAYRASINGLQVAGNFGIAEVNNPVTNTTTAYFLLGDAFTPLAQQIDFRLNGTSIAPAGAPVNAYAGGAASNIKVGGGSQAAPGGTRLKVSPTLAGNVQYPFDGWFWLALPPNNILQLQGFTANQNFTCNLFWIELTT